MGGEASSVLDRLEARREAEVRATQQTVKKRSTPHLVRLAAGAKPSYLSLSPFQQLAWRLMGGTSKGKVDEDLEEDLLKAHMRLRPEEYVAMGKAAVVLVAMGTMAASGTLAFFLFAILSWPLIPFIILPPVLATVPALLTKAVYFGLEPFYRGIPASRAKRRGRLIDRKLTGAMSFISAMASAEVPVDVIFRELSKQEVYGEIAKEAEWITRDTELLGEDILTAIKKAAGRSPSVKFQEFLQGVVTTATSGGQMKPYFVMKAEQFEKEDKLEMKKRMETLGLLAESFVTVVVAFPLFLVVIMAIMALISKGQAGFVVTLLYVIVGLMIPLSQFGFIFVMWNQEQEAR